MKLREHSWLNARIDAWVRAGLLTAGQAEALQAYEREAHKRRLTGFTLLAVLGGTCIALGVILTVAYNWENIPSGVRIAGYLALLLGVGELGVRVGAERVWARRAVLTLWLLLPLAGIGLWGQIYQLSGDPLKPLIAWLLLSLPVAVRSGDRAVLWLHTAGVVIAAFVGAFAEHTWLSLADHERAMTAADWIAVAGALLGAALLWAIVVDRARRHFGELSRLCVALALLAYVLTMGMSDTPFASGNNLFGLTLCATLVPLGWAAFAWMRADSPSAEALAFVCSAAVPYTLGFMHDHPLSGSASVSAAAATYLGALVAIALAAFALRERHHGAAHSSPAWRWAFRTSVVGSLPLAASLWAAPDYYFEIALLANVLVAGVAVVAMHRGVAAQRVPVLNTGVALLGILMLTRFVDYFGNMFESGMAFIVTGLVFVALAWLLGRGRRELLQRAGLAP